MKLSTAAIGPDQSNHARMVDKFAEIPGDIRRAARIGGLARHFHDRHRGFGRDASDFAPDEFVEHEIAYDQDALGARALEDFFQSLWRHTVAEQIAEGKAARCRQL